MLPSLRGKKKRKPKILSANAMSFSLFFHTLPSPPTLPTISSSSFKPKNPSSSSPGIFSTKKPGPLIKKVETLAARDTIIDFGMHRGKMLGTLPSSYLKWVSKNLRAGDSEHWAKLADEVLDDAVYRDRIEWEFAEKILQGSPESMRNVVKNDENKAVSMLLEISERFGWDNEDKVGWSKVNLELLGSTKGGRIPRLTKQNDSDNDVTCDARNETERKAGKEEDDVNGGRRKERRERMRLRREAERDEGKTGITRQSKVNLGNAQDREEAKAEVYSPFPGRESLMKKVLNRRRFS